MFLQFAVVLLTKVHYQNYPYFPGCEASTFPPRPVLSGQVVFFCRAENLGLCLPRSTPPIEVLLPSGFRPPNTTKHLSTQWERVNVRTSVFRARQYTHPAPRKAQDTRTGGARGSRGANTARPAVVPGRQSVEPADRQRTRGVKLVRHHQ